MCQQPNASVSVFSAARQRSPTPSCQLATSCSTTLAFDIDSASALRCATLRCTSTQGRRLALSDVQVGRTRGGDGWCKRRASHLACALAGAGKSTLIGALWRLMPYSGTITVDGTDVSQLPLRALRSAMAIVPQVGWCCWLWCAGVRVPRSC